MVTTGWTEYATGRPVPPRLYPDLTDKRWAVDLIQYHNLCDRLHAPNLHAFLGGTDQFWCALVVFEFLWSKRFTPSADTMRCQACRVHAKGSSHRRVLRRGQMGARRRGPLLPRQEWLLLSLAKRRECHAWQRETHAARNFTAKSEQRMMHARTQPNTSQNVMSCTQLFR